MKDSACHIQRDDHHLNVHLHRLRVPHCRRQDLLHHQVSRLLTIFELNSWKLLTKVLLPRKFPLGGYANEKTQQVGGNFLTEKSGFWNLPLGVWWMWLSLADP